MIKAEETAIAQRDEFKKKREGKKYRAAKPGDKDRPSPEAWKKAQK